jgi:hypothetical protein
MDTLWKSKSHVDELKKHKLFIATPMYGGQCYGLYTKSALDTQTTLCQNMELKLSFLFYLMSH